MDPINHYLVLELKAAYERIEELESQRDYAEQLMKARDATMEAMGNQIRQLQRRLGARYETGVIVRTSSDYDTDDDNPFEVDRTLWFSDEE